MFEGFENNSSILPPVGGSSTSRSIKRLNTSMDIKSGKRIKKIEPKVLIEVKRKGSKIRDYQSKTHYSRGIGSFSTPQNNLTNYESLNGIISISNRYS